MISIVIPALNERKNIGNLLDSILAQDISEEYEVVVADAHSTDGTRGIVESYRDRIPRLQIVDGGLPAVARNNGGRASSGDPIFFLDADVTLHRKDFLRVNTEYFRAHGFAIAATKLVPRSDRHVDHLLVGINNAYLPVAKYIWPVAAVGVTASREAFEKTGGYPEDRIMNEDHDFALLCTQYGPWGYLPVPLLMSMRRFEKEGRLGVVWKYTIASLYRIFVGPIRKPLFTYEFAYTDDEDSAHV